MVGFVVVEESEVFMTVDEDLVKDLVNEDCEMATGVLILPVGRILAEYLFVTGIIVETADVRVVIKADATACVTVVLEEIVAIRVNRIGSYWYNGCGSNERRTGSGL